ncbi:MAG: prepilin-type N-terminal cleavage/methylation domain-containing protein [Candidatus Electrothrix sp. EH2]|nr:prepilin-type N-terminal cleavage/methylation domain-containing protein [Candidatus Electrothrix sp. EH2]
MNIRHYIDFSAYKSSCSSFQHEIIVFNYKGSQGNKEGGFTLIELMICNCILCILAAVAIPNFIAYRDKAFCSAAERDAKSIEATLADYFAIPSHTALPTATDLSSTKTMADDGVTEFSPLTDKNTGDVTGDIDNISIAITDGSGRCPEDYQAAVDGWDADGDDSTLGVFTKTIK